MRYRSRCLAGADRLAKRRWFSGALSPHRAAPSQLSLATSSALVIALRPVRPRERASTSRSWRVFDPKSPDGEVAAAVVLVFGAAVAAGSDVEVVAAVGAGAADFVVDFLVVSRAVGVAFVAVVLVGLFRVEGAVFFAGGFRAVVGAAVESDAEALFAAEFAAEFAVDLRAGFGADLDAVLEVVLRAGDFLASFAAVSWVELSPDSSAAASPEGSMSRATLPGSSATTFACLAIRLAAFCVCLAADSAAATASSRRRSSCLIRLSALAVGFALTTGFFFSDDFAFVIGFVLRLDFVLALAMVPPRDRE